MVVDLEPTSTPSWKDKFLGKDQLDLVRRIVTLVIELMEGLCCSKAT